MWMPPSLLYGLQDKQVFAWLSLEREWEAWSRSQLTSSFSFFPSGHLFTVLKI